MRSHFFITFFILTLPFWFLPKQLINNSGLIRTPASDGHKAYPLLSGKQSFQARIDTLTHPDVSDIYISSFLFETEDIIGFTHMKAMIDAAQSGKNVHLLVDGLSLEGFGSSKFSKEAIFLLQKAGVKVYFYRNPELMKHLPLKFRRMHDKLLMVKHKGLAKFLLTGGRNLKKLYFGFDDVDKNAVEFEAITTGQSVYDAIDYYEKVLNSQAVDLYPQVNEKKIDYVKLASLATSIESAYEVASSEGFLKTNRQDWEDKLYDVDSIKFIHNDPNGASDESTILKVLMEMLENTEVELYADAQYFIPPKDLKQMIKKLTQRRLSTDPAQPVKVNITTNSKNSAHFNEDWKTTNLMYAELSEYESFGQGFNLSLHDGPDKIHSKIVVSDGRKCLVWSANIDPRSKNLNLEVGVKIESKKVCKKLQRNLKHRHDRGVKVYKNGKFKKSKLAQHLDDHYGKRSRIIKGVRSCVDFIQYFALKGIRAQL